MITSRATAWPCARTIQICTRLYIELIPDRNHLVYELDEVIGLPFEEVCGSQIVPSRDGILGEMCKELDGETDSRMVRDVMV